jgi:hypothetical protein
MACFILPSLPMCNVRGMNKLHSVCCHFHFSFLCRLGAGCPHPCVPPLGLPPVPSDPRTPG